MRALFLSCLLILPLCAFAQASPSNQPSLSPPLSSQSLNALPIDKVLVIKSERTLHLLHREQVVKSYRVSLGQKPGPKQYEGDLRTPEGVYWLNWRKHSDKFNLAMHISYPNAKDLQRAKNSGQAAGNMIMLHGTPIDEEYPEWFFNTLNWTDGCIALTNPDMQEVWASVKDGTLIEIRP